MAVSIIIPLPLTNAPPALAIVLMGLGMLMGDGLLVLAGWAVAVAAAVITSLVLYAVLHLGRAAGDSIVALLRSVLGR
jgi:hypothetical protein